MSDLAISVENLGKAYRIGLKEEIPDSLMGAAIGWVKAPLRNLHRLRRLNTFNVATDSDAEAEEDTIWALKDVSFEVKRGEVVGIIGRNGAGKSTLLKVLSRITEPTTGRAVIHGRISALLEVGTGFHPEMSGRENVYMNGTILGMTKREIDRKFDEIVDFSGVEKFLDTPVKRYSSGMKVRLAFAVAAHLEPEILIIDEVLAVGDGEFQAKCLGKMQDVAQAGRTVLFVSHNMGAVNDLCSRAVCIDRGKIAHDGKTAGIIERYMSRKAQEGCIDLRGLADDRVGNGPMFAIGLQTEGKDGEIRTSFSRGDTIIFRLTVQGHQDFNKGCIVAISIRNEMGQLVLHLVNADDDCTLTLGDGIHEIEITVREIPLNAGRFYATIWIGDHVNALHDRVGDCLTLTILHSRNAQIKCQASVQLDAEWIARRLQGTAI